MPTNLSLPADEKASAEAHHSSAPPVFPRMNMTSSAVFPQLLESRPRDLGGFEVRRLLPASARQSVGPYVFFDHMGPARFAPGTGVDVRPHPHIGLATITYLFAGEIMHRDNLGFAQ